MTALTKGRKSAAWQELTKEERRRVDELEKNLVTVGSGDDYHAIREAIDTLNQATMRLAELIRMLAMALTEKLREVAN